ncbi:FAD-linked sulfhydryl oxidase ALR [Adelges cooleyi]|uniref:FAD-linked sulfhydryl oxidase ALR n=1 Tax=Adelges cooleyi TaxID=133065 RepID=UPI0021803739|nr:FAD-linked sulfhydryl oxidase ALR [Adelges cooleyi]
MIIFKTCRTFACLGTAAAAGIRRGTPTDDLSGGSPQTAVPTQQQPCRTCTDFRTFAMSRRQMSDDNNVSVRDQRSKVQAEDLKRGDDCPLDKEELGRSTWNLLHTIAATYPNNPSAKNKSDIQQFLVLLSRVYPCEICADDFAEILVHCPPKTDSQESLSQWVCEVHNMVNRKLGKPQFDCTKVMERWRDGWKDGRCDG